MSIIFSLELIKTDGSLFKILLYVSNIALYSGVKLLDRTDVTVSTLFDGLKFLKTVLRNEVFE